MNFHVYTIYTARTWQNTIRLALNSLKQQLDQILIPVEI